MHRTHAQLWISGLLMVASALFGTGSAQANAVTDWDEQATAVASAAAFGQREGAIVALAMFEAVNSIDHRYQPFVRDLPATTPISREAAVAAAAAHALIALHPEQTDRFRAELDRYLARQQGAPDAVANGARLGEAAARAIIAARADDGFVAADRYRPKTTPGQYVPTGPVVASALPTSRPFVLSSAAQFRPAAPPSLKSAVWLSDYREVKTYGNKSSTARSPEQTETARFWLMTGPRAYHPLALELISTRHFDLVDSARLLALYAMSLADAYIAVFDAKYQYEFWRPVTAIRNGGGLSPPEADLTWEPIDATPMHPEYPCAHCILSGAAAAVLERLAGPGGVSELSLTSPTAPGVTHHWTTMDAFTAEVANARIWAGFHYRNSARVGTAMGREIGVYVVAHSLVERP